MRKVKRMGRMPWCRHSVYYTNEASSSGLKASVTERLRCHLSHGHKGPHVDELKVTEYQPGDRTFKVIVYWPNRQKKARRRP